jgi:hypothetical protein
VGPAIDPISMGQAGLDGLLSSVASYGWLWSWGIWVAAAVCVAALVRPSWRARTVGWRRLFALPLTGSIVSALLIAPAFIFRFTGRLPVGSIQLTAEPGEPFYPHPIEFNANWLFAGYGPKIAWLCIIGACLALACLLLTGAIKRKRREPDGRVPARLLMELSSSRRRLR